MQEIAERVFRKGVQAQERYHRSNGGKYYGAQGTNFHTNVLEAGVEYDAKIVSDYDPETKSVAVTIPYVNGGKGPFTVPVDLDKTWLDDEGFDLLNKGFYIRVKALKGDNGLRFVLGENKHVQGSLIAVRPSTGEILAMVGGYNYYDSENGGQFIRTVQSTPQPGSAFKPLLYATALADESGKWTVASRIHDAAINFWKGWIPKNFERRYFGNVTMDNALLHSMNAGTVWLLDNLKGSRAQSIDHLIAFCRQAFGFTIKERQLAIALGTMGVTPWELAQAYSVLANKGDFIDLHAVRKVWQRRVNDFYEDRLLYEFNPRRDRDLMSPEAAYCATFMLRSVVEEGTAKDARELPFYNVGKTGTTDDCTYAWYAGYSRDMLCIVYYGYDDFSQSLGVKRTGSKVALPVWMDFMSEAYKIYPERFGEFPQPAGVKYVNICQDSRLVANSSCRRVKKMPFVENDKLKTAPKATCSIHGRKVVPTPKPSPYQYQYETNQLIRRQYETN